MLENIFPGGFNSIKNGTLRPLLVGLAALYIISTIDLMPGLPFDDILVFLAVLPMLKGMFKPKSKSIK